MEEQGTLLPSLLIRVPVPVLKTMIKINMRMKGFISSFNSQFTSVRLVGEALSHGWGLHLAISVDVLLIKIEGFY